MARGETLVKQIIEYDPCKVKFASFLSTKEAEVLRSQGFTFTKAFTNFLCLYFVLYVPYSMRTVDSMKEIKRGRVGEWARPTGETSFPGIIRGGMERPRTGAGVTVNGPFIQMRGKEKHQGYQRERKEERAEGKEREGGGEIEREEEERLHHL